MLLAKGQVIYFNARSSVVDYFTGISFECPKLSNPSDYLMAIMSKESIEIQKEGEDYVEPEKLQAIVEEEYEKQIKHFVDQYEASTLRNDPEALLVGVEPLDAS